MKKQFDVDIDDKIVFYDGGKRYIGTVKERHFIKYDKLEKLTVMDNQTGIIYFVHYKQCRKVMKDRPIISAEDIIENYVKAIMRLLKEHYSPFSEIKISSTESKIVLGKKLNESTANS